MKTRWYRQITIIGESMIDSYATYTDGNIKALQESNGFIKLNENSIAQNYGEIITIFKLLTDVKLLEELGNPNSL